jgi:hypothetical protein
MYICIYNICVPHLGTVVPAIKYPLLMVGSCLTLPSIRGKNALMFWTHPMIYWWFVYLRMNNIYTVPALSSVTIRGGQAQLIFESAIAIPQLEGSTSAIAIPQLLKKCCSATATPQFRNRNFVWSPQLQVRNLRASLPQFLANFWPWNPVDSWKKIGGKKSRATVPLRQVFCFQRNRQL